MSSYSTVRKTSEEGSGILGKASGGKERDSEKNDLHFEGVRLKFGRGAAVEGYVKRMDDTAIALLNVNSAKSDADSGG